MAILSILYYSLHLDYQSKKFTYYAHLSSTILGTLTFISFIVFLVHIILNIALDDKSCNYVPMQISRSSSWSRCRLFLTQVRRPNLLIFSPTSSMQPLWWCSCPPSATLVSSTNLQCSGRWSSAFLPISSTYPQSSSSFPSTPSANSMMCTAKTARPSAVSSCDRPGKLWKCWMWVNTSSGMS